MVSVFKAYKVSFYLQSEIYIVEGKFLFLWWMIKKGILISGSTPTPSPYIRCNTQFFYKNHAERIVYNLISKKIREIKTRWENA